MKKLIQKFGTASGNSAVNLSKDEDGDDSSSDFVQLAQSLLQDHREPFSLEQPVCTLPIEVVDPKTFPYYLNNNNPDTVITADNVFIKQILTDTNASINYIRDDWIRNQMKEGEPSFTSPQPIRLWVGTFNVAGKKPDPSEINPFLSNAMNPPNNQPFDIFILGLQEMVDLNVTNAVMSDSATKERTLLWIDLLQRSQLFLSQEYTLLATKSMVGLLVVVFALKRIRGNIAQVQTCSTSTGLGGLVGNKGACSIRFEVFDSSFCIVCAHLAAHMEGTEARNSDVRTIHSKSQFKLMNGGGLRSNMAAVPEKHHSRIASTSPQALLRGELAIAEHDCVIWLGDFNYRIQASAEEVFERITTRDFVWLFNRDQLLGEMKAKRVFDGYEEVGQPVFLPTYKLEPGTDQYDRRPEKKIRAPAWTDRVVWKCNNSKSNAVLFYQRVEPVRFSDHKPVECGLVYTARIVNDESRNQAYRQVLSKLDLSSSLTNNTDGGGVSVLPLQMDFGTMEYRMPQTASVELCNRFAFPVCYRVVSKPLEDVTPSWLRVMKNNYGLLLSGESCLLTLNAELGLEQVRLATNQALPLQFKQVIHIVFHALHEPRILLHDCKIPVSSQLRPTCFGPALTNQLWCLKPAAKFGLGEVQYLDATSNDVPLLVPKEFWRLTNALKNKLHEFRIFLTHADFAECALVRRSLDEGTVFPSRLSPHAYAMVFLEYLDALGEPLVPPEFFPEEQALQDMHWRHTVFSILPPVNANVLHLVLAVVSRCLRYSASNGLTLMGLAPLFTEVVFRPSQSIAMAKEQAMLNASGFGEFASWLGGSTGGGGGGTGGNKTEQTKVQTATAAFCTLVNAI